MNLPEELQEAKKELLNYLSENNITNVEVNQGAIIVRNIKTDKINIDVLRNNLDANIKIIEKNS
ncbi:hypothetical protein GHK79_10490 [Enterococcus faecium]|uniref:hypothetical protein n=1 Tax=Enterococcus faecium TaxID=1352 RepID=UPI00192294E3|nr:hypothetical protein [Enterococcus faecium]MBL3708252.1 hypothetical protein [Enterococcus faecium]NTS28280.1 hypothetical protein [Enterococcus faecium]